MISYVFYSCFKATVEINGWQKTIQKKRCILWLWATLLIQNHMQVQTNQYKTLMCLQGFAHAVLCDLNSHLFLTLLDMMYTFQDPVWISTFLTQLPSLDRLGNLLGFLATGSHGTVWLLPSTSL